MASRRRALRDLLLLASCPALRHVVAADAPKRIPMFGRAFSTPADAAFPWEPALLKALAARGWVIGQNVVVERVSAGSSSDPLSRLAEELVRKRPDVILCYGDQEAMSAAARATQTIPIVVFEVSDPVGQGLVDSFARPGRNVTGISLTHGPDLTIKRLEYLRAIAPSATRLCWLWGGDTSVVTRVDGTRYDAAAAIAAAAEKLQWQTRIYHVTSDRAIDQALADAQTWRAQALTAGGYPSFLARRTLTQFALRQRWPSAFAVAAFVADGGLLSLAVAGSEVDQLTVRWADYVDRVLRGGNPAEMPVISADRYELQINTKTAEALQLTIPPALLLQADALVR